MKRPFYPLLLLFLLTSSGCSAPKHHRRLSQQINQYRQQAEGRLEQLQQPQRRSHFVVHRGLWFPKQTIALPGKQLPACFNRQIGLANSAPLSITAFGKLIHRMCGLPVTLTPDALQRLQKELDRQQPYIEGIRWQGNLEGLLDTVAASLGLSWKYNAGSIVLYYLDTRTFQIYAIPSDTEMHSTIESGIDLGRSSAKGINQEQGKSAQSTSVSLKSSLVSDIHRNIKSMLTPNVGKMSSATSTGTITVTDIPEVLGRIAHYVHYENRTITKQVLLNIKLLSVVLNDAHQLGINWSLIHSAATEGGWLRKVSGAAKINTDHATINILSGQGGGSESLMQALSRQGKISMITSPSVTTLNLQPVPVQVATQESYLARIEVNQNKTGSTISMEPGMITHGFNMSLLPFVMSDNQLLLQYTVNLSELIGIKILAANGEKGHQIQLPEINSRLFSQRVKLRSNETLILSGFEQSQNAISRKGQGSPHNWLLGGKVKAARKRQIIVLMITPTVIESACPY